MNQKSRRFPLPLSSVVEGGASSRNARRTAGHGTTVTPQTATRNAMLDLTRQAKPKLTPRPARVAPAAPVVRPAPLVSDAVRKAMVARVAQQGVRDAAVLAALEWVPRHLFIEPALVSQAYIDAALPIGYQQTISQPYIVARMAELLRANRHGGQLDRVLEIGTGCGYQAAVLARLARDVYSVERIKPLHELAKVNLRPMRIANIRLHYGDGMLGLPQAAPFDGIILAAAGLDVPPALLEQLAVGGRLVAPVGAARQMLELIVRVSQSEWRRETLEHCHFVPLCAGTI